MSGSLSTVEGNLPPGFRFHPKDDELICDYLMKKLFMISSSSDSFTLLIEVDLNKCEPWDIPERACVGGKEWYFYSQRDRKYATGLRTNRATVSGYWKATGKDRAVVRKGSLVGMRKTLVFYQGRAPKGRKTDWVMHEFRLEGAFGPSSSKEDWVLCRVFHNSRESIPPRPTPTQMNGYDESSLPDLMDSLISFDQTPQTNDEDEGHVDNITQTQNNVNSLAYNEQVPRFSNQATLIPNQPTMTTYGINSQLHHQDQDGRRLIFGGGGVCISAAMPSGPGGSAGACDRHVIKEVLSHLITNNNVDVKDKTTSSPSPFSAIAGGGSSSESYLSDVGFPTMSMWTSHY